MSAKRRKKKKIKAIITATIIGVAAFCVGLTAYINPAFKAFLAFQVDSLRPINLQSFQTYINPSTTEKSQMKYFQSIDPEIREVIKDTKIQFLNDTEYEEYRKTGVELNTNGAAPMGSYGKQNDQITIRVTQKGMTEPVIIHEAGHAFDARVKASESEELKKIVEEEIDSFAKAEEYAFKGTYIKDSVEDGFIEEYFAEAFLDFYARPLYLKAVAPKTFQYMKDLVSEYKGDQL